MKEDRITETCRCGASITYPPSSTWRAISWRSMHRHCLPTYVTGPETRPDGGIHGPQPDRPDRPMT